MIVQTIVEKYESVGTKHSLLVPPFPRQTLSLQPHLSSAAPFITLKFLSRIYHGISLTVCPAPDIKSLMAAQPDSNRLFLAPGLPTPSPLSHVI